MTRVLILEARFYHHIADDLLKGAVAELAKAGVEHTVITVPGVLELPAALKYVVSAIDQQTTDDRFDGYVTLGCAIRGQSEHFHHVCTQCMRGLQDLALTYDLAVGNGVLTVHNEAQALDRCKTDRKNLGGQAARACLRMIDLKRELNLIRP